MWSTGIMGNLNKFNPGPGAYETKTTLSPVAFSMSIRTANYDPAQTELKKSPRSWIISNCFNYKRKRLVYVI